MKKLRVIEDRKNRIMVSEANLKKSEEAAHKESIRRRNEADKAKAAVLQ